jgi:redox-sensitive bicupin YhaK (pirin superfamily)
LQDLGGFTVRRVLPARERRMVGPFIFLDHMGPKRFAPGEGIDVRPHPHIALATVTYLFEGEIFHRDSLGSALAIRPGAVNWMTAGRGIVHSERTRDEVRATGGPLHGIQAWVALPGHAEECAPAFVHYPAERLPTQRLDGAEVRLIAGAGFGMTSAVTTASPLFYADANLVTGATLAVPADYTERAVYVVEGAIEIDDLVVGTGEMAVLAAGHAVVLRAGPRSRVMLLGGEPLDGDRHIWWNFVASSRERIERAKADWAGGRFPKVPGDEDAFIPLPGT